MSNIDAIKQNIENIVHTNYQEIIKRYGENLQDILWDTELIEVWIRVFANEEQFTWWLFTNNIFFSWKPLQNSVEKIKHELINIDYSHLL